MGEKSLSKQEPGVGTAGHEERREMGSVLHLGEMLRSHSYCSKNGECYGGWRTSSYPSAAFIEITPKTEI